MNNRDTYIETMKTKLDEWNLELDKLSAKANAAKADAQLAYREQIEALRKHRDDAGRKLEELAAAGDDAWDDVKLGLENAWRDLEIAVKSASSRFG